MENGGTALTAAKQKKLPVVEAAGVFLEKQKLSNKSLLNIQLFHFLLVQNSKAL